MGRSDVTSASLQAIEIPLAAVANGYQDLHQSDGGMRDDYSTSVEGGDDVSATFLNSASLICFAGVSVLNGTSLTVPHDTLATSSTHFGVFPVVDTPESRKQFPETSIGNAYSPGLQVDGFWTLGRAVSAPWATVPKHPVTAVSRYAADEAYLRAVTGNPTIAYRIDTIWSAGIGAGLQTSSAEFATEKCSGTDVESEIDVLSAVSGACVGVGYALGAAGMLERMRSGWSHRSMIDHSLDGKPTADSVRDPRALDDGSVNRLSGDSDVDADIVMIKFAKRW
jgi:long-chain fatty acid transport protein